MLRSDPNAAKDGGTSEVAEVCSMIQDLGATVAGNSLRCGLRLDD